MVELAQLWLPIVVSAVILFVASSIIWMALPIHKHDYKNPGDKEEAIIAGLSSWGLRPGLYFVPWCHGKPKGDPAFAANMKSGPWAMLTVMPSPPNMGKMLAMWFVHLLLVGLFVAYLASNANLGFKTSDNYLSIFRVTGTAALLAHAGYALPMCIWHGLPWSQLPGRLFDGVVYALLTAGTFGWLWPEAVAA